MNKDAKSSGAQLWAEAFSILLSFIGGFIVGGVILVVLTWLDVRKFDGRIGEEAIVLAATVGFIAGFLAVGPILRRRKVKRG